MSTAAVNPDLLLADEVAKYTHDPEGYCLMAFPWTEGDLAGVPGPRKFQRQVFQDIREHLENPATRFTPLLLALASGHGIGKSSLIAMLSSWGLDTCEDCRIIITANTATQLETKTSPELAKWFRMGITSHWWQVGTQSIKSKDPSHTKSWRADLIPWNERNPQATAGTHNQGKRIIIFFDEASEIPEVIWETISGALTDEDTEIIWIAFGQRTLAEGYFASCFGDRAHRWKTYVIDSRDVEGTNKALFAEWVADYGEDSDYVRVRVRGLAPRAGDIQFIDSERIRLAQERQVIVAADEPLIAGVDMAWGGDDWNVIRFRCGKDARSIPSIRIPGEKTRDPNVLINKLAEVLRTPYNGRTVNTMFVDSAGIAGKVVSSLRQLGFGNVIEVTFGADSPDIHYANMRAFMWGKMKEWLLTGAIDKTVDARNNHLAADLAAPGYRHRPKDSSLLLEEKKEIKKRIGRSPDDGDALALTFPYTVAPVQAPPPPVRRPVSAWG